MQYATDRVWIGILAAGLLVALATGAATGQSAQVTQTDSQRGISVKATYLTPSYLKSTPGHPLAGKVDLERSVAIAILLDTHSGDLSKYDFVKNALLRNNRGQQVVPTQWVATAEGSHHRAGGLVFPKSDASGRSLSEQATVLQLVIRDLGGVGERNLRWTLPLE